VADETKRRKRVTLSDRLHDIALREEAVERAAANLAQRAERLRQKAEELARGADAVMGDVERDIEKRAAEAREKARAASMFTEQHAEVADRLAKGLPAFDGAPRPTARETTAALQLLATLDAKAKEREAKSGSVVILVVDPFADGGVVKMQADRAVIEGQRPGREDDA
jgi:hypothetical protein